MKKLLPILASLAFAIPAFSASQGIAVRAVDGYSLNQKLFFGASLVADDTFAGVLITNLNAGATVAQWDAVYLGGDSKWLLADADGIGSYPSVGLVTSAAGDTDPVSVLTYGIIRNDSWGWTPGATLFLSTTAGGMTQIAPGVTGDKVQVLGYALTADIVFIGASQDFVEIGEAAPSVFTTNLYSTNVYSTTINATTNFVEYNFSTNLFVENSYFEFFTNNYAFITNLFSVKNSTINFYAFDTTITNGLYFHTNNWPGPSAALDMRKQKQSYGTDAAMEITGLLNRSNYVAQSVVLTITNSGASVRALVIPADVRTGDGARTYYVTNGQIGVLSIEYDPSIGTNAVYRPFW